MSFVRCNVCSNQYVKEQWDICPFCHGRTDWRVFRVPRIVWKGDPRVDGTYHLYSEETFVGIYIASGSSEYWVPIKGTAFWYYSHDPNVVRSHSLFYAREAVRRAKMNDDFIKDERFV